MKEFFKLQCNYEDMSPVIIPSGYTKDYIDGKISEQGQLDAIHRSFEAGELLLFCQLISCAHTCLHKLTV